MKKVGIDVSRWNGSIDWQKVKDYGIDFAMVRLGHGRKELFIDPKADYNIRNCMRFGIPVGVYVYSYSVTPSETAELMRQLVEIIIKNGYKLDMPIAYDIEYVDCHTNCDKTTNSNKIKTAMQVVESYGYYGIIYASIDFLRTYTDLTKLQSYDKWVAAYRGVDDIGIPHGMWQYSNKGAIPGINGDVDKDCAYIDYPAIIKRAGLNRLPETKLYKITVDGVSDGDKNTLVEKCKELKLNYCIT